MNTFPSVEASLPLPGPSEVESSPTSVSLSAILLPSLAAGAFLLMWDGAVRLSGSQLFPKPIEVLWGLVELAQKGLLIKYVVASLFRVTWGFTLAVLVGIPFGLVLGSNRLVQEAFNPLIQGFRPISPIAWIPVAILWFGVSDAAPVCLLFLASVFPIMVSTAAAVKSVPSVYLRAADNFGLTRMQLFRRVIFPASLPQIITGLRIALGIAWLVVVAAEMIAVNSGLGYLIIDARNAGKRYDLVVAGMVLIGLIGWGLDLLMRQAERVQSVKWAYGTLHD